jgi:hypothetical protein
MTVRVGAIVVLADGLGSGDQLGEGTGVGERVAVALGVADAERSAV